MSFESLSENCASFETKTRNYKMDFSFVSEHWKFWDQKPNSATFERGGGGEEGFTPKQIDNSYPNKQIVHSDLTIGLNILVTLELRIEVVKETVSMLKIRGHWVEG